MTYKNGLKLCVAASALMAGFAATDAMAGGFAVREQSTLYQGMSFAGAASGDHLSGMFWNPAAAAAETGMNAESHAALLIPDSNIRADSGVFVDGLALPPMAGGSIAGLRDESSDISDLALVPSSYANYQWSDTIYLGLAINSPFGLITKPENSDWAGSPIAQTSDLFTLNVNPNIAYKATSNLTIGVGLQLQYLDVRLNKGEFTNAAGVGLTSAREIEGEDIGFGGTAGIAWTTERTSIGLGYRSPINVELEGDYKSDAFISVTDGPVAQIRSGADADFTLPEIVTLSLRHNLTERLAVLGTVEWTNWSRLGTVDVTDGGDTLETLEFNYEDGWFYSLGVEYLYSPKLTVRAGVAYEESPVTDETRNVLLPDADRIWLSIGGTYKYSERMSFDVAYTHIFVDDAPFCRSANGDCDGSTVLLEGEAETDVDILSVSMKYKLSQAEPELEPLK